MSGKRQKGDCCFCGKKNIHVSKDHIPPQSIYPKPNPPNLITVPNCDQCNNGTKLHDEYFKIIVAAMSRDSPQSKVLLDQSIRRGVRERPALASSILKTIRRVAVFTDAGIATLPELEFDRSRLQVVISKIVRGLYRKHHNKSHLPDDCVVDDFEVFYRPEFSEATKARIQQYHLAQVGDGNDFMYRYTIRTAFSDWVLIFYDRVFFVTSTHKPV